MMGKGAGLRWCYQGTFGYSKCAVDPVLQWDSQGKHCVHREQKEAKMRFGSPNHSLEFSWAGSTLRTAFGCISQSGPEEKHLETLLFSRTALASAACSRLGWLTPQRHLPHSSCLWSHSSGISSKSYFFSSFNQSHSPDVLPFYVSSFVYACLLLMLWLALGIF